MTGAFRTGRDRARLELENGDALEVRGSRGRYRAELFGSRRRFLDTREPADRRRFRRIIGGDEEEARALAAELARPLGE